MKLLYLSSNRQRTKPKGEHINLNRKCQIETCARRQTKEQTPQGDARTMLSSSVWQSDPKGRNLYLQLSGRAISRQLGHNQNWTRKTYQEAAEQLQDFFLVVFDFYLSEQDGTISVFLGFPARRFLDANLFGNRGGLGLHAYAEGFAGLRVSAVVLFLKGQ